MSAEADAGDRDDPFHSLILGGLAMRTAGFAARRVEIIELHRQGFRPPDIARELQRRARQDGCSEEDIARRLGVSEHNVRFVLRAEGLLATHAQTNV